MEELFPHCSGGGHGTVPFYLFLDPVIKEEVLEELMTSRGQGDERQVLGGRKEN